jgi:succinate dehydrogenase/fumarate reductase-like Fe-S protein
VSHEMITVRVFRFDPAVDGQPRYDRYVVPGGSGMSVMDLLDYIYQHLDSTLAYHDHAGCSLGICGHCAGRINGRLGLFCQTPVRGDTMLQPSSQDRVLRDLVTEK